MIFILNKVNQYAINKNNLVIDKKMCLRVNKYVHSKNYKKKYNNYICKKTTMRLNDFGYNWLHELIRVRNFIGWVIIMISWCIVAVRSKLDYAKYQKKLEV